MWVCIGVTLICETTMSFCFLAQGMAQAWSACRRLESASWTLPNIRRAYGRPIWALRPFRRILGALEGTYGVYSFAPVQLLPFHESSRCVLQPRRLPNYALLSCCISASRTAVSTLKSCEDLCDFCSMADQLTDIDGNPRELEPGESFIEVSAFWLDSLRFKVNLSCPDTPLTCTPCLSDLAPSCSNAEQN